MPPVIVIGYILWHNCTLMEQSKPFYEWQEQVIRDFETNVDTHAFEAMIDDYKIDDVVAVSFEDLVMDVEGLPHEIRESHYFPRRFTISKFEADFSRYRAKDSEGHKEDEEAWSLLLNYRVNGQPYKLLAGPEQAVLSTNNFEGAELRYRYDPITASRLLATIAATQLSIEASQVSQYLEDMSTSSSETIFNLLNIIGTHDESALYFRSRSAWLPLLDSDRALVTTFAEMQSSADCGRKLSHKLAWQLDEGRTTEITSSQREFGMQGEQEPYFSQRTGIDFGPDELLIMAHWLGYEEHVGEYIDAYSDRAQYAHISAAIKFVLDSYLAPYAHLDAEAEPELPLES